MTTNSQFESPSPKLLPSAQVPSGDGLPDDRFPPTDLRQPDAEILAPRRPESLADSGLTVGQLADLCIKLLYLNGGFSGHDLAAELKLPFSLTGEALRFLKDQRCVEVVAGDVVGPISQRFVLTELGRLRARDVFERCRYVGPAPVPLSDYVKQCRLQTVIGVECSLPALRRCFQGLVLRDGLLEELGPAVCSGRSIFLHGPPGNGKTVIARRLADYLTSYGGEIYVPYALAADESIITLFDPSLHRTRNAPGDATPPEVQQTDPAARVDQSDIDRRWRRIHRPVIVTAGELTLDMLDLRFHPASGYYSAPLHIKANGGVFLIDDFGRQLARPEELLNRWILPLEERIDFLTLTTGKKIAVPFEQLTVFSTNLQPRSLVDDAFLRRIRHKICIDSPTREAFARILEGCCRDHAADFSPDAVDYLFSQHYNRQRLPRSSDPRDLLEIASSICRFRGQTVSLSEPVLAEAARRLFCEV